jgi:hypothetical protein
MRHHREHVEGDYRKPPPAGIYESRHRRAEDSLRFDPVTLRPDDRAVVCRAMARTLLAYGVELIDMSVGGQHFHVLCRFPLELPPSPDGSQRPMPQNLLADGRDPIPRHVLGRAKRAASVAMLRSGPKTKKPEGRPLWAKRAKFEPIRNRQHQLNLVGYIRDHACEGAVIHRAPALSVW